jgi:hypothetical protein
MIYKLVSSAFLSFLFTHAGGGGGGQKRIMAVDNKPKLLVYKIYAPNCFVSIYPSGFGF